MPDDRPRQRRFPRAQIPLQKDEVTRAEALG
jgi:hypothetical protein